ncbi:MAG: DUF1844 domain-containing protein [Candidatus Eisenbacteria bacterium]
MVENAEKMDALFVNLVLLFKNAALQQMGKIMNPITGKIEKSMEQASFSIDMLEMLKGKSRGNLSEDLGRLLDSTLLELRMNYVEETEVEAKQAAGKKTADGEGDTKKEPEKAGKEDTVGEAGAENAAPQPEPDAPAENKGQKRDKDV